MISELPHSREAERVIVGCPIISESSDLYHSVAEKINPSDFFFDSFRDIFLATGAVLKRSGAINMPLVAAELAQNHSFASESLARQVVVDTCHGLPRNMNLKGEAVVVKHHSLNRRILRLKATTESDIALGMSGPDVLEILENGVADLRSDFRTSENFLTDSSTAVDELLAELEEGWTTGKTRGLSTGIPTLDDLLMGLQPGKLYTVAARTGHGKTWLALNATVPCIREEKGVLFISLEMMPSELTLRLLANLVDIDARNIRNNYLSKDEKSLVRAGLAEIKKYAVTYGRPGASVTPNMIRGWAKKLARKQELGLIVVDYLQLVDPHGKHGNRQLEVAEVSKALKRMSMELKVPVMALSQLNRNIDYDKDREPELCDLRESGTIEQDSDVVMFLHGSPKEAERQILVKKHRGGPMGDIDVIIKTSTGRFSVPKPPETGPEHRNGGDGACETYTSLNFG